MELFSKRLKEEMKLQGLTQEDLAKKCYVGQKAVSKWLSGESEPKADSLFYISKALDISCDYLLGLQDEKEYKSVDSISRYTGLKPEAIEILKLYKEYFLKKDEINPISYLLSPDVEFQFILLLNHYFSNDFAYEGEILLDVENTNSVYQNKPPIMDLNEPVEHTRHLNPKIDKKISSINEYSSPVDAMTIKSLNEKDIVDLLSRIHESITHLGEKQKEYNNRRKNLILKALESIQENEAVIMPHNEKMQNDLGIQFSKEASEKLSTLEKKYATNKKKR